MRARYARIFSLQEIERSPFLQILYWVLLFGFFLSFRDWIAVDSITRTTADQGKHVCPPFFQDCARLYFLDLEPASYSQAAFFAGLFGFLTVSAVAAARKRWDIAHAGLLVPTLFKIAYVYALSYNAIAEYEYFHVPVALAFLFAAHKEYFVRRIFVLVYFFSATMKFDAAWIAGTYFTSLRAGMPLFPDSWVPFVTNGVAIFEIFSPWLLLSERKRIRWAALGLWVLFHLYSILLVGTKYPSYCLPLLLALFLPDPLRGKRPGFSLGWILLAAVALISVLPWTLPGNKAHSLQGRRLGVQMFDANHQCVSETVIRSRDGRERKATYQSSRAMRRCGPYQQFFRIQQLCRSPEVAGVSWNFHSSVNGEPFYRIVSTENACALRYREFGRNEWILAPETGAPITGYPRKNSLYRDKRGEIRFPSPDPNMTVWIQDFFLVHEKTIAVLYWALWAATALFAATRPFWTRRR